MPEWFLFTPCACFELFSGPLSPASFPRRAFEFQQPQRLRRFIAESEIGHLRSQATAKSRCRPRLIIRKRQLLPSAIPSVAPSLASLVMPLLGFAIGSRRPSFPSKDVKQPLTNPWSTSETSLKAGSVEKRGNMDHFKIPGLSKHGDRRHSGVAGASATHPSHEAHRPVKMSWEVESPPLISYNPPSQSSGALFSAQLVLDVTDPSVVLQSIDAQLSCTTSVKKPVSKDCPDCTTKLTELKKWSFVKEPLTLQCGKHRFPLSYLFPGHLPATTHADLAKLDYHVAASAKTITGETITFNREVLLARSIMPGQEKHSIRVFPPTNLTAHVTLNPIVHPIGEIPVSLRLSGLTTRQKDAQVRWRLRKMNWRIEEHSKMISPACPKHSQKVGGDGKGILHEDTRTIGEDEVHYNRTPWKTDFDAGEVDVEFHALVNPAKKPVCDVNAPNGLTVTHSLFVEMVVAEEWTPWKKTHQATPTGAARILRMQFNLIMTERAGMGISWDEETPPVYEDVPASPPSYSNMEDYDLEELGHIEDLQLGETLRRPTYEESTNPHASSSRSPARPSPPRSPAPPSPSRSPARPSSRGALTAEDLLEEPPELTNWQRRSIDTTIEDESAANRQPGTID